MKHTHTCTRTLTHARTAALCALKLIPGVDESMRLWDWKVLGIRTDFDVANQAAAFLQSPGMYKQQDREICLQLLQIDRIRERACHIEARDDVFAGREGILVDVGPWRTIAFRNPRTGKFDVVMSNYKC